MLKLTLDTNAVINLLDFDSSTATSIDELSALIRHAMDGNVNLCITTVVSRDLERDQNDERRLEMLRKIEMFPVIGTLFRLGASRLGYGEMLASDADLVLEECVRRILAPMFQLGDPNYERRVADVDHLLGHKKAGRDVFVTDDVGMIKKADVLQQECGLKVMSPREVLDLVERSINRVLLAEDFQAGFGVVTRLIESHLPDEPWTPSEQRTYEEHRSFLLRTFPKLYPSFNSYWAQAGGDWQPAGDPFRPFYAEETGEAAVAAFRRERQGGFEWESEVAKRAARLRTVLVELVGYIEA